MIRKYILTGGPGVGKSTVMGVLEKTEGIYFIGEAATYIIEQELARVKRGEKARLPWTDRDDFQKMILEKQLEWEAGIPKTVKTAILDRGIIDGLAYYHAEGLKAPEELEEAARNSDYHKVFLLNPLENLERTASRRENKKFAEKLHEQIQKEYLALGYEPIRIPLATPEERAKSILEKL